MTTTTTTSPVSSRATRYCFKPINNRNSNNGARKSGFKSNNNRYDFDSVSDRKSAYHDNNCNNDSYSRAINHDNDHYDTGNSDDKRCNRHNSKTISNKEKGRKLKVSKDMSKSLTKRQ